MDMFDVLSCTVLLQFPITALREIKILQQLKHDNVVKLNEICRTKREFESHLFLDFLQNMLLKCIACV